jgi:hypothetical protein
MEERRTRAEKSSVVAIGAVSRRNLGATPQSGGFIFLGG